MNSYVNDTINLAFSVRGVTVKEIEKTKKGYTPENRKLLIETAAKKKVLPVVGKLLCDIAVDTDTWLPHYERFQKRNLQVIAQVNEVFEYCHANGIHNIAIYENFGALLYSDTDIALYSSGDVDFYADVVEKQKIVQTMEALGYSVTDDKNHRRDLMTECLRDGAAVRINIGWKPLRRQSLPIGISTEKVIDWNKLVPYKNTSIRILDKNALLYLCLLRIAVHGYSRSPDVRLYIDIYNAVCTNPDWDTVIAWAKADKVLTKIVTVAYISNQLNGVHVPDKVIEMAKVDKYARKIIQIVYDEKNMTLKYDPSGLKLLKLEAASDNKSVVGELFIMAFPPVRWVKAFYAEANDSTAKAYLNYYKWFISK